MKNKRLNMAHELIAYRGQVCDSVKRFLSGEDNFVTMPTKSRMVRLAEAINKSKLRGIVWGAEINGYVDAMSEFDKVAIARCMEYLSEEVGSLQAQLDEYQKEDAESCHRAE